MKDAPRLWRVLQVRKRRLGLVKKEIGNFWVLVETVAGWKLRPTQGCSRGSGLLSAQMDTLCYTLGMFSKDGLCKACPLPTPTAWL